MKGIRKIVWKLRNNGNNENLSKIMWKGKTASNFVVPMFSARQIKF
jgi:hypothetical protein